MARRKRRGAHSPAESGVAGPPLRRKVEDKPINRGLAALSRMKIPKDPPVKKAPTKKTAPKNPKAATPAKPLVNDKTERSLAGYSNDDRIAFHQAFAGVESLDGKKVAHRKQTDRASLAAQVRKRAEAAEDKARDRLDALVSGGLRFEVQFDSYGEVQGRRQGASDRTCRLLAKGELPPALRLDLHGSVRTDVARSVRKFVREAHKKGHLDLAIIHGKGLHSEGGKGVLQAAVVKALTQGGAAPLVDSFASAPSRLGGHGALLIRLRRKL